MTASIPELTDEVKASAWQRLSSPFMGTFIVAWIVANWDSLLLLAFGGVPIELRVREFSASHPIDASGTLWGPFVTAVAVVALYPWVALGLFNYNQIIREKRRVARLSLAAGEQLVRQLRDQRDQLVDYEGRLGNARETELKLTRQFADYRASNALYLEILKAPQGVRGGEQFDSLQTAHARVKQAIEALALLGISAQFEAFAKKVGFDTAHGSLVTSHMLLILRGLVLVEPVDGKPEVFRLSEFGREVTHAMELTKRSYEIGQIK